MVRASKHPTVFLLTLAFKQSIQYASIMNRIDDFFETTGRLLDLGAQLDDKAQSRLPATLRARQRFYGSLIDFRAASLRVFRSYLSVLPWAFCDEQDFSELRRLFPSPSEQEMEEIITLQLMGLSQLESDEARLAALNQNMMSRSEALFARHQRSQKNGSLEFRAFASADYMSDMKAFLFACRAYQDATYSVLIELKGGSSGIHTSISDAIKKGHRAVYLCDVLSKCVGYETWFKEMRDLRNLVKLGAIAEIEGAGFDVSVLFQDARDGQALTIGSSKIGFSGVVDSVHYSQAFTDAVLNAT
jgi:hypothetical protein